MARIPNINLTANQVAALQIMLNAEDIDCGKVDGKFGQKTRQAFYSRELSDNDRKQLLQQARKNPVDISEIRKANAASEATAKRLSAEGATPAFRANPAELTERQPHATLRGQDRGTIILDPGHGGLIPQENGGFLRDAGTTSFYEGKLVTEYEANWALTQDIATELRAQGYKVVLTKSEVNSQHIDRVRNPTTGELEASVMATDRTSKAPDALAYVSIHQDHRGNNNRNDGIKVNYSPLARPVDQVFAQSLANNIGGSAVRNERNIAVLDPQFHKDFIANKGSSTFAPGTVLQRPAVLIEATNFSSSRDLARVMNQGSRWEMAQKIASGIVATISEPNIQNAMIRNPAHQQRIANKPQRQTASALPTPAA